MKQIDEANQQLKEKTTHGTAEFPIALYDNLSQAWESFYFYPHWHEEIEILYILEGKMELVINQSSWILTAGSVVLIPPNIVHLACRVKGVKCVFGTIVFSPDFIDSKKEDLIQQQLELFINESFSPSFLVPSSNWQQQEVNELIRSFTLNFHQKNSYRELLLKGILLQLLAKLLSYSDEKQVVKPPVKRENEKKILSFIEENYMKKITLTDMAEVVNFSQEHFARFFKAHFKLAPMYYLNQYRIRKAANLLLSTDLSMMEIAEANGFQNSNYFAAVFKKNFGVSPTEFRKNQDFANYHQ